MLKVALDQNPADVDGVWAEYAEGVRFKIARAGNPVFLRASDRLEAPYRNKRNVPTIKALDIQCQAMAEGILRDWEGVGTEEGALAFSVEAAFKVLRFNAEVREFVFEFATTAENFRREEVAKTAKK